MTDLSEHVSRLRGDESLRTHLELEWLEPGEQDFYRDDWLELWNQIPFDDAFHDESAARLTRCVPLARGLSRERRLSGAANELMLVFDPQHPDAMFLNLSHTMPARLWLRMEPTGSAIIDATAPYLTEALPISKLERTLRLAKFVDLDDLQAFENAVLGFEMWIDDSTWASDFNDDPWLSQRGPLGMIDQTIWLRDTAVQHPGRFPSKSFRTLWSKSVLTVEQHAMGAWVFELHYNPAGESEAMSYINEVTHSRLPLDLPLDLGASLLRGRNVGPHLLADLAARGEGLWERMMLLCALAPGEPTTVATLRQHMLDHTDDDGVLGDIADLAANYRHYSLLFELAQLTEGTPLGDQIRGFLNPAPQEVA